MCSGWQIICSLATHRAHFLANTKRTDDPRINPRGQYQPSLVRAREPPLYISALPSFLFPHSCARARTVASEVFTEAQSFADCKLHIRTRLLASAFSNFWKTPHPGDDLFGRRDPSRVDYRVAPMNISWSLPSSVRARVS